MKKIKQRDLNEAAYRKLKPTINRRYPVGRFIAIHRGAIVSDAPSFDELDAALRAKGVNTRNAFVVQAGENLPDYVDIFCARITT